MTDGVGQGDGGAGQEELVGYGTPAGRWVLAATILGSGVAFLDSTVVNVALPAIGEDLGANVSGLQWILTGYLLSLASLILLGGSLGDRFGRRRVFVVGVVWFAVASLLCGLAPSVPLLVAARVLQGVGGALLTPGSLAIIEASFRPEDRGRAIGAWSGLGGIATAIGPFLGGYLVDAVDWRWVFLLNLPLSVAVVWITLRHVPESSNPAMAPQVDLLGAVTGSLGLAGLTYALIEAGERGLSPLVVTAALVGAAAFAVFLLTERRSSHPMLPLGIFASSQFTWTNVVTFAVYGALGGVLFLLVVHLQQVLGYSALQAGTALLPVTFLMLLLSAWAGALSQRIGPRLPMALGPVVAGIGVALLARILPGTSYLSAVLPAIVVFGLGLSLTVAPLTTTVLAAADDRHSGVASGVNNAVARAAQLLAVAVLPVAAGLTGDAYENPTVFAAGFQRAALLSAGLLVLGGVLAWLTIDPGLHDRDAEPQRPAARPDHPHAHCDVHGPPLRTH
jgi:EmrB/QacA subfamily drug resistance transporter